MTEKGQIIQIPEDIKKREEFIAFCSWCATPKELRDPKDQKQLAPKLGVDVSTLSLWKDYPEFDANRRRFIQEWLGDDLPAVMDVVKRYALRGNLGHIQTLLKWLGELSDQPVVNVDNRQINIRWRGLGELEEANGLSDSIRSPETPDRVA